MVTSPQDILAIEVGSSRIKLGWFPAAGACASDKPAANLPIVPPPRVLPEPSEVFRIDHKRDANEWIAEVGARLDELALPENAACVVAAVHHPIAETLKERVLQARALRVITLSREGVPLQTNVREPSRVGIDRLLNALAANRIRQPNRPAIVVDIGTAMTVNLITADGVFQGGAILTGPMTALSALHAATSSLPLLDRKVLFPPPSKGGARGEIEAPPAVGKFTEEAMAAGAYWGTIGAARELIVRTAAECDQTPEVFLTGGASTSLAPHIGLDEKPAMHMPNLILSGIHLAADGVLAR